MNIQSNTLDLTEFLKLLLSDAKNIKEKNEDRNQRWKNLAIVFYQIYNVHHQLRPTSYMSFYK